jgi:hypothetical protein
VTTPKYADRVARLPEVFERLAAHPDGVALTTLADAVGAPVDELREDLLAFFTADLADTESAMLGLWRPNVLEFLGPDGASADPNEAEVVRITNDRPTEELGVEYVDAAELGVIYTAALALHDIEGDDDLGGAIDVLTETLLGQPAGHPGVPEWNRQVQPLQTAQRRRNAVRIVYSRAWEHGVTPRVIHPYRLVQTRRGWEVDAGPPDDRGRLRTYLLSGIRDLEVLERTFTPPAGLPAMLEEQRSTTRARVCLPHSARWAADMYAEHVTVVQADEESVSLDLDLLPPLDRRVGMLLLAAGPDAFVVEPRDLESAGVVLAEELLVHHDVQAG